MIAVRAFGLLVLFGSLAHLAYPQTGMPGDMADKPSVAKLETKKIELTRVSNEDLLKQAQLLLDKAGAVYLAQLRELATVELASEAARKQTDALPAPKAEPTEVEKGEPLEVARAALDRARGRLEWAKKRLDMVQLEKALIERSATVVEASSSAALAFANLLEDMNAFVVEIGLRVKDRTLPADAIPKALEADALTRRKQELMTEQDQWKQKAVAAQKQIEAANLRLAEAKKSVLDAESRHEQAIVRFSRERKQKSVDKEYSSRTAKDLLAESAQLLDEEAGLTGAFNLALRGFRVREATAGQRRKELDALEQTPEKGTTREDGSNSTGSRAMQELTAKRVQAIETLGKALQAMISAGEAAEAEGAVLGEHLFKLQVVGGVLKKAAMKEPLALPKRFEGDALATTVKTLGELTTGVSSAIDKAKADRLELEEKAKDAQAAATEADKRIEDLKASREANKRVAEFEKTLRTKTAAQVATDFTADFKSLDEKTKELEKDRGTFNKARDAVAELHKNRASLKDPYLRLAESESQGERQKSLDDLKKYAGLDRAPRDGMSMTNMMSMPGMDGMTGGMSMTPEPKKETEKSKEKDREKEGERVNPYGVQGFQQLLATRVRVIEEQEEVDDKLLESLSELEKAAGEYSTALGEVRQLMMQQFVSAVELKKRVGRGELTGDDVPDGLARALQRDEQTKLDATASALVVVQAQTRQEQERIRKADATLLAANKVLKESLALASQRLDLLADLKRLEAEYRREKKELSESEVKRVEQSAIEHAGKEDSWAETLVSIDNSPAAKTLVDVLQTYYREVVTLEEKQDLLKQRKEKSDTLVDLVHKETALLGQARPLIRDYIASLELARDEEQVLARAKLKPEEADELLRAHQTRTGKQLPRPIPVAEKDRAAAAREAGTAIFERGLAIEAARRWERLIEGRLTPVGLPAEMGTYQDQIGALTAAQNSNNRRMQALNGKDDPTVRSEIAGTRSDLFLLRRSGVLWIALKIAIVLLLTWILPPILTWLLRRATTFADRGTAQVQAKLVMAFMQAFLKLIVYTVALVLVLSIFGFDITAILAGLGIGGLAIGLAAQHAISDMLGGIIIFMERPFSIGDTVKIGESEPAQVVGLTWRITQLRDPDGIAINIPNRQVTEAAVINLTREGQRTYDTVSIPVPATYPVGEVIGWIEAALAGCRVPLAEGRGVDVEEMTVSMHGVHFIRYQPFYFVRELSQRDDARCEVLTRVAAVLSEKGVLIEAGVSAK